MDNAVFCLPTNASRSSGERAGFSSFGFGFDPNGFVFWAKSIRPSSARMICGMGVSQVVEGDHPR